MRRSGVHRVGLPLPGFCLGCVRRIIPWFLFTLVDDFNSEMKVLPANKTLSYSFQMSLVVEALRI